MRYPRILFLTTLALVLVFAGCSQVDEQSNPVANNTVPNESVDMIVAHVLDSLATLNSEEDALALIHSYPQEIQDRIMDELKQRGCPECPKQEPQSNHPAAQTIIKELGVLPEEIIAVQMMVWSPDSPAADTVFAVVTDKQWYYVDPSDLSLRKSASVPKALTTEVDIYGSSVENVGGWCVWSEWVVVFYLPVCFYELTPHQFDGILDAWAPNPPCDQYNGGICAAWLCGSAWDGPGYDGWYNYHTCQQIDYRASTKAGKLVQKRWIYTWRNAGRSDTQIANSVRARIRY
ncbi:hypothetical protein IID19_05260 [Patescibacteria group bacterium]|nr:hypothetical protein [Patescibacteria group bacterium]